MKNKMVKLNKKDCRNCKHFFVCAYPKHYDWNLGDLLESIRKPEISNNEKQRKLIYEFLARACQYFNKDCYSRDRNILK